MLAPPAPAAPRRPTARRGFTLAEVAVAVALAGVMAALAVPGLQSQQRAAGRLDAVDALTKIQAAQSRRYAQHGLYASELRQLDGAAAPQSPQGRYAVALVATAPDAYVASATARADGPQAGDTECATLTLEVRESFAQFGPSARCWGR